MADDRRIIFGVHVVPFETGDVEETIDDQAKTTLMRTDSAGTTVNKRFGGKGICTDVSATQWSDSWTSFAHPQMNWEDWADDTDVSGNRWEHVEESWALSGIDIVVSTDEMKLSQTAAHTEYKFVYIKNTGDYEMRISLNDNSHWNTVLDPGECVAWKGWTGWTYKYADEIWVKSIGTATKMEYILAT